jgi:hypothetical protein
MPSIFDPSSFLSVTMTQPLEARPPLPTTPPEGGFYSAIIGKDLKSRAWTGRADPTKSGIAIDLLLEVLVPPSLQDVQKRTTVTIRDSIMLDITEGGDIDDSPGRNGRLKMYREAIDRNKKGDSFTFPDLCGQHVRVKLSHEVYEGRPIEKVDAILRAA